MKEILLRLVVKLFQSCKSKKERKLEKDKYDNHFTFWAATS